jgi:hypothetical protein
MWVGRAIRMPSEFYAIYFLIMRWFEGCIWVGASKLPPPPPPMQVFGVYK